VATRHTYASADDLRDYLAGTSYSSGWTADGESPARPGSRITADRSVLRRRDVWASNRDPVLRHRFRLVDSFSPVCVTSGMERTT
jgi:hypothetical protein